MKREYIDGGSELLCFGMPTTLCSNPPDIRDNWRQVNTQTILDGFKEQIKAQVDLKSE